MPQEIYQPDQLLSKYRALRDAISDEDFFCKPGMSRLKEMWCAAHFGRTYMHQFTPCTIRMDDVDEQGDSDFELGLSSGWHPFQVAEIMEPARRRSDEYKNFIQSQTTEDDWDPGTKFGAEWIASAISAKVDKKYSREAKLNLLMYVNFSAWTHEYGKIVACCANRTGQFHSVWLINGSALCCVKAAVAIQSFFGWKQIPSSEDRDAP